jgi:DNA-nicking Smr family endonuclease
VSKKKDPGKHQPFEALKELKKKMAAEEEARKAAGVPAPKPRPAPAAAPIPAARDEDEAMTFHRMMSGVVPLDRARARVPQSQSVERNAASELAQKRVEAKTAIEAEQERVHEHLRSLAFGASRFEIADDGRRVEGRRVDLPPDALRRLRRGLMPIDARLDLHGMRAGEARQAVEEFLRAKRASGERCVLIVHGKGEHSPGAIGVLRGEVAAWLSQGRGSEHVAAFATAQEADGGEGAVYVLLRR